MKKTITKAIIPAGGLGTRWLPVTKSVPKELLPVNMKPMIQYSVEEAVKSGINEILFIIRKEKELIKHYFTGKVHASIASRKEIRNLTELQEKCTFRFAYQKSAKGLMDAVSLGEKFAGGEPFAVLLPDNVMVSKTPCLKQLLSLYNAANSPQDKGISYVVLKQYAGEKTPGEVDIDRVRAVRLSKIKSEYRIDYIKTKKKTIVKLKKGQTSLKIFGRYLFSADVFEIMKKNRIEYRGEFDDTPVFNKLAEEGRLRGKVYGGLIFDTGNVTGYNQAVNYFTE